MRKKQEVITDDLDGSLYLNPDEVESVSWTEGGQRYVMDLGPASLKKWKIALDPFRQAMNGASRPEAKSAPATVAKEQRDAIRDWWKVNWRAADLPEPAGNQGRIPKVVNDAFNRHDGKRLTKPVPAPGFADQ